jgi:hypothetical protein
MTPERAERLQALHDYYIDDIHKVVSNGSYRYSAIDRLPSDSPLRIYDESPTTPNYLSVVTFEVGVYGFDGYRHRHIEAEGLILSGPFKGQMRSDRMYERMTTWL